MFQEIIDVDAFVWNWQAIRDLHLFIPFGFRWQLFQHTGLTVICSCLSTCSMCNCYLRQGGYVFARVCLSVYLGVSKITQKVMDGSFWNSERMSGMA